MVFLSVLVLVLGSLSEFRSESCPGHGLGLGLVLIFSWSLSLSGLGLGPSPGLE